MPGPPARAGPVACVGAVVPRAGSVLLVRRAAPPLAGCWALPGGRQRRGEDIRAAARREVAEETGIDTRPELLLDVVDLIARDESGAVATHHVIAELLAPPAPGTDSAPRPGSDAAEAAFFPAARAKALVVNDRMARLIEAGLAAM